MTGGGDEEKKEDEEKKDGEEKPDEAGGDGDEGGKTEEEVTIEQLQQQIEARQAELDKRLEARRAKEKEERIQTEIVTVIKLEREKLEEERLKLVEERIRQTWRPWVIMLFIIENLLRPITYGILYGHSNMLSPPVVGTLLHFIHKDLQSSLMKCECAFFKKQHKYLPSTNLVRHRQTRPTCLGQVRGDPAGDEGRHGQGVPQVHGVPEPAEHQPAAGGQRPDQRQQV